MYHAIQFAVADADSLSSIYETAEISSPRIYFSLPLAIKVNQFFISRSWGRKIAIPLKR